MRWYLWHAQLHPQSMCYRYACSSLPVHAVHLSATSGRLADSSQQCGACQNSRYMNVHAMMCQLLQRLSVYTSQRVPGLL